MEKLTEKFILELFHCAIRNPPIFDILISHLEYSYLPKESHKLLWKSIVDTHVAIGKIPSLGVIAQQHATIPELQALIGEVKQVSFVDKDQVLKQFESFIKQSMFVELNEQMVEAWGNNDKEKAIDLLSTSKIHEFNITTLQHTSIFQGFSKRNRARALDSANYVDDRIPTCIYEMDEKIYGGFSKQDTSVLIAQSGAGKSKYLTYLGVNAANMGYKVLHVQAEGARIECEAKYDATWIGMNYHDVKNGLTDGIKDIKKRANSVLVEGGEVYVHATEKFGTLGIADLRLVLNEFKMRGIDIDMVIVDYFEKLNPISAFKFKHSEERQRRFKLAEQYKDVAVEFNCHLATATQASNVQRVLLNNPEFVMTRDNISEVKALVDAFSYVMTFNQTEDEYEEGLARIYMDKLRNYKKGQTLTIAQDYNNEQFYDKDRTLRLNQ